MVAAGKGRGGNGEAAERGNDDGGFAKHVMIPFP
jgi:hypothetical protein